MLNPKILRAVPSTAAILCGVTLTFGDWITRNPLLVFFGISVLLGLFLTFYSISLKAILILRGEG